MIALIDNYDSFSHNLARYFVELGAQVEVFRNDAVTVEQLLAKPIDGLVISPGPCTPNEAGISLAAIKAFAGSKPILGVCLGHQAIAQSFGGNVIRAKRVMHGKTSTIRHRNQGVFATLEEPLTVTRYHSLLVERESLPSVLQVDAWVESETGGYEIMGFHHSDWPIFGVQFHPESVMTQQGHQLLSNFLAHV